ncbi:MAG: hypothetical protein AAF355_03845 [Myxococcota bacterium]
MRKQGLGRMAAFCAASIPGVAFAHPGHVEHDMGTYAVGAFVLMVGLVLAAALYMDPPNGKRRH